MEKHAGIKPMGCHMTWLGQEVNLKNGAWAELATDLDSEFWPVTEKAAFQILDMELFL